MTRQNKIPLPADMMAKLKPGEDECCIALVPGWDMMNHEVGTNTTVYDTTLDALQYNTMHACASGEEVSMCYGSRPNDLLLIYSGFCVENNPYESLDGDISLPSDSISRVRDCFVKSVGCSQIPVTASPGESLSNMHRVGNVMFSVTKREGGKLPDMAMFGAVAAVMTRDEAGTLMRLRPASADDLFAGLNRASEVSAVEGTDADTSKGTAAVTRKAGDDLRIRAMQYVRDEISKQRDSLYNSLVSTIEKENEHQKSVDNVPVPPLSDNTDQLLNESAVTTTNIISNTNNEKENNATKRKKKGKKPSKDEDDDAALEQAMALNKLQQEQQGNSVATGSTQKMGSMHGTSDRLPEPFRQAILKSCRILVQVPYSV